MRRVDEDVGVLFPVQMRVEVPHVQNRRELRTAILRLWAEVGVELVERGELGVLGRRLVCVGRLHLDPHCVVFARLLEQGQEMRCQRYVRDVVDGHVSVDARVGELVRHYPPCGVEAEDVEPVGLVAHLLGHLGHGRYVGQVTLEPGDFGRVFGPKIRLDLFDRVVDCVFGHGDDEDFGDVGFEECVGCRVADSLAAAGDQGYFARLVGDVFVDVELILGVGEFVGNATHVLGDCGFDGVHGCRA